ncbi:MAG: branched-chain amino acid ABC transporter permease [Desulfobacteraceae bacterium]|nr:branched-chain amino acid ABC transporter permease [Desulfobacteraceae bacterium]
MDFFIVQTLSGISFAAILFLLTSGLSLIFGVMNIVNVAHGSYYMLGGYIGLTVYNVTGSYFLALLGGGISIGIIGIAMQRFFLRTYVEHFPQVLMTMGFALIFRDLALLIWGGDPLSFPAPVFLQGSMHLGEVVFPIYRLFVILLSIVVAIALWLFNEKTSFGAQLRATVDDKEMATGVGINVPLVSALMFGLGALLAAIGGVVAAPFFGVYAGADFEVLPIAFLVVIVGGMGSLKGAAVGSILVGLVDNFGKALLPDFSYFTLFLPMAIILAIRPTGLFGIKTN